MLRVEGLQKQYGPFMAVKDMTFTLEPGSIFGFVGPNGAGKTTTMKMIATLLKPTAGRAFVGDIEVTHAPAKARQLIGYMPDFFGVYDDLRVTEYMDFYADCHEVARVGRTKLIEDLLELVNLGHKRDAYVDTLSRGMKQRLCLARCLVHNPAVLILDEPASGLDPRARIEMRELLHELHRMGKTILISSHILAELSELCTHIGIVNDGILGIAGPVDQVLRKAGARVIEIRVAGNPDTAVAHCRTHPVVVDVREESQSFRVVVEGEDDAVAQLLASLIGLGVPVVHFAESRSKLEDVFLAVTGGEPA